MYQKAMKYHCQTRAQHAMLGDSCRCGASAAIAASCWKLCTLWLTTVAILPAPTWRHVCCQYNSCMSDKACQQPYLWVLTTQMILNDLLCLADE
jgi:hypothetical protein